MLKDGLKEVIIVKEGSSLYIECESVFELMWNWYMDYVDGLEEKTDITYRGKKLKIVYDVVIADNEEKEVIEETDFVTIRKDLEEQINIINSELDGE
jgi:hypothetical protein